MNEFDELAELIANKWYGGTLPLHPSLIVKILMATIPDTDLSAVPAEVREEAKRRWAEALLVALRDRIAAQDAAQGSEFQN